ncbi:hypothetical protein [Streptomyces sp. NPDC017991]|uniref:hypothetical protein n=1 Tax=Streptomyces sp. NPDC017991 TaxID=3365026 RepID=UPI00379720CE
MSQRTVSDWSGVSAGTLKNLARIGLLPEADALRPHDVVLARVAAALGATRSTNRVAQPDARTAEALKRDWEAIQVVTELLLNATFVAPDTAEGQAVSPDAAASDLENRVNARTRLVALPTRVQLLTHDYDLLRLSEEAMATRAPFQVLPVGVWYQELLKKLRAQTPAEEAPVAA